DEMARKFSRDMVGGCRMAGEIEQHGTRLLHTAFSIGLADDGLRARLVRARVEEELATAVRIVGMRADAPTGQRLGETGHVVLRIAGADTERVQFHDLAREILVETAAAINPSN